MPQYVVRVKHNLKGGGEAELGQHTLIVGPNGSGKSAIVNAVELALTGKASDIGGRDVVAQAAALASMANGSGAWAEVDLDDGSKARWETTRTGSRVSRPRRTGRAGVVPLREVVAHLTGSADKARKFLLQHACEGVEESTIKEKLDRDQLARYERLTKEGLDPIENLLAVGDLAAKQSRDATKRAEGARETENAVAGGLEREPTEAEVLAASEGVGELDRGLHAAQSKLRTMQQADTLPTDAEVTEQRHALERWTAWAKEDRGEKEGRLRNMSIDSNEEARGILLGMVNLMEAKWTEGSCLVCGQDFDREAWRGHADLIRASLGRAHEKSRANREARKALEHLVFSLEMKLSRAEHKLAELQQAPTRETTEVGPPEEVEAEIRKLKEAHETAQEAYVQLRESRACWDRVSRAREVRRDAERERDAWAHLAKVCKSIIEELVEDAVSIFSSRVQRYLPEGDTFAVKLTKSAVTYGLLRDGEIHSALSGSEWARVSTALGAACTPAEADVAVLVPEDRAWDPKTLRGVLQGLSAYRGQVLVATTIKPWRGVPSGWNLIEVGGES